MPELHSEHYHHDLTPSGLERLRAGDSMLGSFVDVTYRQRMLRFCLGYLGDLAEAEDAVQEIFCKILDSRVSPENFRPWLYKVARNHCINRLRERDRYRYHAARPELSPSEKPTGNLTRLVRQELRSRIGHLVAALPALDRELLRLRYTEELSRAEMAQVLDLPESEVKARLFQALQTLREHTSLLDGHR